MQNRETAAFQGQLNGREGTVSTPVDIFEDAEGIARTADMPGVSKDRLNIEVDRDTMLVEGQAHIDMPESMEALYADVRSTHYRRSFALSGELETDSIAASLKDGVLSLRMPKRAEAGHARYKYRPLHGHSPASAEQAFRTRSGAFCAESATSLWRGQI
ncbi:MAG: Hsp20/alpha crystallin family protein [Gammaproteobacteria bacterium]|nr:Hsp20/alpha crystallin family protein [Gammaproteobacteria bacterium]